MGGLIRRHPFWTFYALAVLTAFAVWVYLMVMEVVASPPGESLFAGFFEDLADIRAAHPVLHHHGDSVLLYLSGYLAMPIGFAGFFFPFAPTLAAVVVTWWGHGARALGALISLYKPIHGALSWRDGLQIYAVLFALIVCVPTFHFIRDAAMNDGVNAASFAAALGVTDWGLFITTTLVALFLNQGALLEELGWRGYAQPVLMERLSSPLVAALVLGLAWALWHFPREVPPLLSGEQTLMDVALWHAVFIPSCCAMSVVAAYFVNITGGSVLPAIFLHGSLNHIGAMLQSEQTGARVATQIDGPLMWVVMAVIIVITVGPDLGWRRRAEIHAEGPGDPARFWTGLGGRRAPAGAVSS